jgi:hypothetical protein
MSEPLHRINSILPGHTSVTLSPTLLLVEVGPCTSILALVQKLNIHLSASEVGSQYASNDENAETDHVFDDSIMDG